MTTIQYNDAEYEASDEVTTFDGVVDVLGVRTRDLIQVDNTTVYRVMKIHPIDRTVVVKAEGQHCCFLDLGHNAHRRHSVRKLTLVVNKVRASA